MSEATGTHSLPFGLDNHIELLKERDSFELSMKEKYGEHWDRRMDPRERRSYSAIEDRLDKNDRDRLVSQQKAKSKIEDMLHSRGLLAGDPYDFEVRDVSFSWPNKDRPDRPYGIGIHIVSSDKLSTASDRVIGYSFKPNAEGNLNVHDVSAGPFTAEQASRSEQLLSVFQDFLTEWSKQTWLFDKGSRFQPVHREETVAVKVLETKMREVLGFVETYPNMRIQVKAPKGKRPGELRVVFLNIHKMISVPFIRDEESGLAIYHPGISAREKW